MNPIKFEAMDGVLGAPQAWDGDKHGPCKGLPVLRRDGVCISCWKPTWRERIYIFLGKPVWLHVVSGKTQPPVAVEVNSGGAG